MASGQGLQLPGVKHKVIGLVSGGKDSCFNLIHCVANGHELVAIATLQPEAGIGTNLEFFLSLELMSRRARLSPVPVSRDPDVASYCEIDGFTALHRYN